MSIERAIKFCKLCYETNDLFNNSELSYKDNNGKRKPYGRVSAGAPIYNLDTRNHSTKEAMLALEESLNKNTREATALERDTTTNSLDLVRDALLACINCDYSKPSIVDIFIMKSQD